MRSETATEKILEIRNDYQGNRWNAHMILAVSSLLYIINFMDRQVLAAVLQPMKLDLKLTDAQAGALQTVFLLSVAFFAVPISIIVDRWSRKKSMSVMAGVWSIFTFVTGLGASFTGVLVPRTLVGVGEAGFTSGATAMVSAAYPERLRARVLGILNGFTPVGAALGSMLGGWICLHYGGWRTPFYIFAAPGIILGLVALLLKDYKTVKHVDHTGKRTGIASSFFAVLKIPTLRWLYVGYGLRYMLPFSILAWLPAYLMRSLHASEAKAGMVAGLIVMMGVVGAPLGGLIADLWQKKSPKGRLYLCILTEFLTIVTALAALILDFSGLGFFAGILFGIFFVFNTGALFSVTQDVVTPAQKGASMGLAVLAMYLLGGGWGPIIVGKVSDAVGGGAAGLAKALMFTAIASLAGGFCFWMSSRHYTGDKDKVSGILLETEK